MKPVMQTIFDDVYGDCFRACVASIFEFSIEEMPNFWEQTQDASEFWRLNNSWLMKNYDFKVLSFQLLPEDRHVVESLLCIACAKSPRSDIDHAVVWQDGLLHDPHPSGAGLTEKPDTFTLFVPINPNKAFKKDAAKDRRTS